MNYDIDVIVAKLCKGETNLITTNNLGLVTIRLVRMLITEKDQLKSSSELHLNQMIKHYLLEILGDIEETLGEDKHDKF